MPHGNPHFNWTAPPSPALPQSFTSILPEPKEGSSLDRASPVTQWLARTDKLDPEWGPVMVLDVTGTFCASYSSDGHPVADLRRDGHVLCTLPRPAGRLTAAHSFDGAQGCRRQGARSVAPRRGGNGVGQARGLGAALLLASRAACIHT